MANIDENIEDKKDKSFTKYGYVGIGVYFFLLLSLKIGLENFNDALFWIMISMGIVGFTMLILLTGKGRGRMKNMVDRQHNFDEKIVKDTITIPEVYDLFYNISTNRGYSAIYKEKHILGTYGDEVKRRIFILTFVDEYDGSDNAFLISLSEPQHYTFLDTKDWVMIEKSANALAYAKEKEPVIIREQRYITGEDGQKKKIETLTEQVSQDDEEEND